MEAAHLVIAQGWKDGSDCEAFSPGNSLLGARVAVITRSALFWFLGIKSSLTVGALLLTCTGLQLLTIAQNWKGLEHLNISCWKQYVWTTAIQGKLTK